MKRFSYCSIIVKLVFTARGSPHFHCNFPPTIKGSHCVAVTHFSLRCMYPVLWIPGRMTRLFFQPKNVPRSCFECKKTRKIPPAFQYHGVVTFILVNNLVASWKLNLYIELRYGHPDIHFLATLNCKFEKLVFWNIFIHNLRIYEVSRVLFQRNIEFLLENERSPRWSWNGLFWSITLDWHP